MTVPIAPSPIAVDAATPGTENPKVPPNFVTYVRVETASFAGPLGWIRRPAADGSPRPNSLASTSRRASVWPGAIVYTFGGPGVPASRSGRSETVTVTG